MRLTDIAHLGLMLGALGLTYLVPVELLLLAYVVLGPAHYSTEISWLHDRNYFLPQRGIAIGLVGAALVTRLLRTLLFGVTPGDPVSLVGSAAILLIVAALASAVPAWRASRVDPMSALRTE